MSQHSPQGNLISNTTRDAIGLLHQTSDLFVLPAIDSVFHGAAKGILDWAGAPTNQPATCPPSQLGQQSASRPAATPSHLGQSATSWQPAAPSQFAQPSARGVLDWAGATINQPTTSAPPQLGQQSASSPPAAPSQLGQSSASWPPVAPSQIAQPSASWPPVATLVTWMPLFQTTCQPTQQVSDDLAALSEIVKALVALNKELASRINLLQESVRQLCPRQYAQANNTSTPNMQPSLNISPEVGNNIGVLDNAGLGNNSGVISRGDDNVQAAGKTDYGLSHWNRPR